MPSIYGKPPTKSISAAARTAPILPVAIPTSPPVDPAPVVAPVIAADPSRQETAVITRTPDKRRVKHSRPLAVRTGSPLVGKVLEPTPDGLALPPGTGKAVIVGAFAGGVAYETALGQIPYDSRLVGAARIEAAVIGGLLRVRD